ncbi:MAG: type I DNA topoisomerase [Deltaproteobacteria bacterium]|nr:type I DNA topoisomerase [Deltaproteobacteria bacterium]
MAKPLVVVESPTKVKTLKKYIGKEYNIVASVGHIKDLPSKELGIDIESGFKPIYKNIPGKQKVISSLKKAAKDVSDIYLAPDPDREGEAIAWHIADVLAQKGRKFHRVLFHEITKKAVQDAIKSPEALHKDKYEAQQARRMLDRIVGYQISPLLWRKVKGGLSAGRVQSVAVRIICERERAIQVFDPKEYWSMTAHLQNEDSPPFPAKLVKKNSEKFTIPNETVSTSILNDLSEEKFIIQEIKKKTTKRNPLPPFTTSKLQQESIRKLRFSAKKTMMIAQQLYEGIDLGHGEPEGLITYMRTDSTRISSEAAQEALKMIQERFGEQYALEKPRFFKNRKKAQDAHEAIRPTSVYNTPEKVEPFLSKDQFALYALIWKRFVASQMQQALINNVSVSIQAGNYLFTSSGSTIKFPGFMTLYLSADDEIESKDEKQKPVLPELKEGVELRLDKLEPKQHFTMPPPRFSEASLVKELEENGIGRPSTYAAILSTIRGKGYVELIKGYFRPSELGFIVNDLLVQCFPNVFDVDFTAKMEDDLDRIEDAKIKYFEILNRFYEPFSKEVDSASECMLSIRGVGFETGLICPECNHHQLHIKIGRNGHYLGCDGYPDCTYTRNYIRDEKGKIQPVEPAQSEMTDKFCEKCEKPMMLKSGKYGDFLACSGYPDCKNTQSIHPNSNGKPIGIKCPETNCTGDVVEKKSKRGNIFYGCSNYPDCTFASWDKPVEKKCPNCGADFLVEKSTKKKGTYLLCISKNCGYEETD